MCDSVVDFFGKHTSTVSKYCKCTRLYWGSVFTHIYFLSICAAGGSDKVQNISTDSVDALRYVAMLFIRICP